MTHLKTATSAAERPVKYCRLVWPALTAGLWIALFIVLALLPKSGHALPTLRDGAIAAFEIAVILVFFGWIAVSRISFQWVVVAGMSLASGLILAMLIASPITGKSVHPDEFAHLGAYEYYVDHLLPPAVDDLATIPSTSVWGTSYLSELDVVYEIAARATGQLRAFTSNNLLACRLFQFAIWGGLCLFAVVHRRWAVVLSVTLLSPQIWYIFSYFNADAFPLALALIAAGFVSDEYGGLGRFLRTGNLRSPAPWIAALCIGLILVSKANYLPVVLVFLLWLAVIHLGLRWYTVVLAVIGALSVGTSVFVKGAPGISEWHMPLTLGGFTLAGGGLALFVWHCWRSGDKRPVFVRLVSFTLLCILIAAPRVAWDVHVNGWPSQKAERIQAVAEARAAPEFKPSIIAQGKGYPTIDLAARGVSLKDVFFAPYHWAATSLTSAFGVYGYMTIFGPNWLYWLMYAIAGLVVLVLLYSLKQNGPEHWLVMTTIVVGGAVLVLASSLLLSWTRELQAQGRYLFAILPMIALLFGHRPGRLPRRTLRLLIGAACICSVVSFAFVALPALAG